MNAAKINVVLVRSKYPGNIGSSARALANMGGNKLILVDPQASINSKARQGAAGSQVHLDSRIKYKSMQEFFNKEAGGVYIALSARSGKKRQSIPLKQSIQQTKNLNIPIYFIFGPEDHGLSTEDMSLAHHICHIPTFGEFTSLNLSQAVLLTLFIARDSISDLSSEMTSKTEAGEFLPEESLKTWIEQLGIDLSSPRTNAYTTLRDLLLKAIPTKKEIKVLETVLQQTIRQLKD